MIYNLKFEEIALKDFNNAIEYYDIISSELGDEFYQEFWNKIDDIKINPLHFQLRYKLIRIAHLKKFPFGIHFIIEENTIKVFRILHHKQFYK